MSARGGRPTMVSAACSCGWWGDVASTGPCPSCGARCNDRIDSPRAKALEARELQRGDLVVERDGELLLAPFMVLRARWYGDHLCTLSVLVLESGRMIGGCSFGGTEQLGVTRPDFDPVIEHYRAAFASFIAERGL